MPLAVKQLRQGIMAIAAKKYGWNYDEIHDLMKEWGYGNSLRALPKYQLYELYNKLRNLTDNKAPWEFDDQGKLMWHLAKLAWPKNTMKRLQHFWIKKYQTTHFNALSESQKRATINMLRRYANGNNPPRSKSKNN